MIKVALGEEYYKSQIEAESHESVSHIWMDGQRRWVRFLFHPFDRDSVILDIACGDGVGLLELCNMGFRNVFGVELNPNKAANARNTGYRILQEDMHDLAHIKTESADVLYSSHTLEHAKYPGVVLKEFHRVLKPGGNLFLILPYPDMTGQNDLVHCGKHALGTDVDDHAETVKQKICDAGFWHVNTLFDGYRESEVFFGYVKPLEEKL